ncbi:hypothetical protein [Streptomyces sp. NPDC002889]|uniref:hypothetical protein n=1 Tax=Streptomyces sp. NPDC002889 TaxID=3364669 RepID=UPI0036C16A8C
MTILQTMRGPHVLGPPGGEELVELTQEIREFPIRTVATSGGRPGADLGHRPVPMVEDNGRSRGVGRAVGQALREAGVAGQSRRAEL